MVRTQLVLSFSLAAALAGGCAGKDGVSAGDPSPQGGDAGSVLPGEGGVGPMSGPPGTSTPGTGGIVLPPTSTEFHKDATTTSGVDPQTVTVLKAGGASCSTELLYPYADTVLPGGLVSPPIMWRGEADASYVRMAFDGATLLDYQFAAGRVSAGEIRVPAEDWAEITRRSQGLPLKVTLSVKRGSAVSTCETRFRIAQGNMVGSIYYNTYNEPKAGGVGAIMRLRLGTTAADLYLSKQNALGIPALGGVGACTSCHSVSSSGSTMAASTHDYVAQLFEAQSFTLADAPQPAARSTLPNAAFAALTPDGSRTLTMGNPDCTTGADTFPRGSNNFPMVEGPAAARLLDSATGQPVATSGLKPEWYMWMPQFSPNGDRVVFNHAKPDGAGGTDRRELAIMDFDKNTGAFSNLRVLVSRVGPAPSEPYAPGGASGGAIRGNGCAAPNSGGGGFLGGVIPGVGSGNVGALPQGTCTGPCYPAWPFFTPDGQGVIYAMVNEPDFMSAFPGRDKVAKSELWYVDVSSLDSVRLDNANKGLRPEDGLSNYYPTVLPVQVGGYFWLFWTSTRDFGHRQLTGTGSLLPGQSAQEAFRKRIWVSAIKPRGTRAELNEGELTDLSSPPFYLEGQGETGNTRAFAALNPCKPTGNECTSGLDCCTGFCNITPGQATGQCVETVSCAKANERCETDANCCPAAPGQQPNICIGGYCGFLLLQ